MKAQPEEDDTPGRDALALALLNRPEHLCLTHINIHRKDSEWVASFTALLEPVAKGRPIQYVKKSDLLAMSDEWQGQMAQLLNQY